MSNEILVADGLRKTFGSRLAVNGVSLRVERGNIYGILGPNGSGKSTTLGMVLGALTPNSGTFRWFGQEDNDGARKKIGTLLEGPIFYPYLTAFNNLKINATIKKQPVEEVYRVLDVVKLSERANSKFKTFSTGMKQRLAIANALLGDPEVLVLDEPTNGLDPQGIAEVRDLVKKLGQEGKTILLASHLLDEVEKVCTHVAVLRTGNLLYQGEVGNMAGQQRSILVAAADNVKLMIQLKNHPGVQNITEQEKFLVLNVREELTPEELNSFLYEHGITLSHLSLQKKSLETQFLELTGKN
ncbi:MAG: ATP-binding cassette domain-containing protein [Bacteroidota bacterium]|nr:ATP-binding cassette domain-containing protein [Bacteroidota bacterium]